MRALALPLLFAGCATVPAANSPQDAFAANLRALCGRAFEGQLRRPNRYFRVEFDLPRPAPTPLPPWGSQ